MAAYDFRIIDDDGSPTGEVVELRYPMGDRPNVVTLEDGRTAMFDFQSTARTIKSENAESGQELWAFSTTANQVDEFRRKFPNRTYRDDGMLISHSYSETKRIVKEHGCVDTSAPQKIKSENARKTLMRISHA